MCIVAKAVNMMIGSAIYFSKYFGNGVTISERTPNRLGDIENPHKHTHIHKNSTFFFSCEGSKNRRPTKKIRTLRILG